MRPFDDHFESEIKRADQARLITVQSVGHFELGMYKIGQCNLSHKGLGNQIQSQQ